MDKESRQVTIFFTFCIGAVVGFYASKYYLVDIITLLNKWFGY